MQHKQKIVSKGRLAVGTVKTLDLPS